MPPTPSKLPPAERPRVAPNEWRVGDYRGTEYPVFANVIAPGDSDSQTFTLTGGGTWDVADRQMVRTDSETLLLLEQEHLAGERVQLQRARLPDGPHGTCRGSIPTPT